MGRCTVISRFVKLQTQSAFFCFYNEYIFVLCDLFFRKQTTTPKCNFKITQQLVHVTPGKGQIKYLAIHVLYFKPYCMKAMCIQSVL